eukprot:CAMPEP_0185421774 /NCGR_PEP_ID=MMETSP1365-20130426/11261_1 /TAXON_ID=38817 /ORGANISM="Gephyrocapsa oceanica, Strain RCC1303" /LENGTH=33 /DNA_ID= /DNA_START= /DNA_END= /DNA_ORIENTATION=
MDASLMLTLRGFDSRTARVNADPVVVSASTSKV